MRVYTTGSENVKFHASKDCRGLTKGQKEAFAVELATLQAPKPCLYCYPDYPVLAVVHLRCTICNTGKVYPCQHNGGVRVLVPTRHGYRSKYVWPENSHAYEVAPESIRV
jgi:hypothetical protein